MQSVNIVVLFHVPVLLDALHIDNFNPCQLLMLLLALLLDLRTVKLSYNIIKGTE
jgi:hypothetical protein